MEPFTKMESKSILWFKCGYLVAEDNNVVSKRHEHQPLFQHSKSLFWMGSQKSLLTKSLPQVRHSYVLFHLASSCMWEKPKHFFFLSGGSSKRLETNSKHCGRSFFSKPVLVPSWQAELMGAWRGSCVACHQWDNDQSAACESYTTTFCEALKIIMASLAEDRIFLSNHTLPFQC